MGQNTNTVVDTNLTDPDDRRTYPSMLQTVFPAVEAIGIVAFGLSGYFVARRRCLDIYGTLVLALVAALGGGTIRDLILGRTPPVNLLSPLAIALASLPSLILSLGFLFPDRLRTAADRAQRLRLIGQLLLVADAVGLSAFTVSGVLAARAVSGSVYLALFCGVLTATGGGMIRDLLAGVVPAVLRREVYAAASLCGALSMVAVFSFGGETTLSALVGMMVTGTVRLGSYALKVHLPAPAGCPDDTT